MVRLSTSIPSQCAQVGAVEAFEFQNLPNLMSIVQLSLPQQFWAHAQSLTRSTGRLLFKRTQRNRIRVLEEYHHGHWAGTLSARLWEQSTSLEEFLIGSRTHSIVARVDGKVCRLPCREFYLYRLRALASLVRQHLGANDPIVELGAGFGYNLFALALAFPDRRFIGLDLSSNGVQAGREISAYFGMSDRVSFDLLDLTDAHHKGFAHLAGNCCLTFFCIEQMPSKVDQVLANILAARPRRVLHVEPTIELLNLRRPSDWANYAYVKSLDYQTRLFAVLREMDRRHSLRLIYTGRAVFAPTVQNDGFIALWEPTIRQLDRQPLIRSDVHSI